MTGVPLPGGGVLYGQRGSDPNLPSGGSEGDVVYYGPTGPEWGPPERQTWQAAGGSAPAFGAVNLGGGAVAPTLGPGAVVLSTFNRMGRECFATMRIHTQGTGTGATGGVTITGLPVAPDPVGSGTDGGQNVGYGFIIDGGTLTIWQVTAVIDPFYSLTEPLLFCYAGDVDGTDPAGLNSAAVTGAVTTDTPEVVPTVATAQRGGFLTGSILAANDAPIDWGDAFYLNLTFQYQGVG